MLHLEPKESNHACHVNGRKFCIDAAAAGQLHVDQPHRSTLVRDGSSKKHLVQLLVLLVTVFAASNLYRPVELQISLR